MAVRGLLYISTSRDLADLLAARTTYGTFSNALAVHSMASSILKRLHHSARPWPTLWSLFPSLSFFSTTRIKLAESLGETFLRRQYVTTAES